MTTNQATTTVSNGNQSFPLMVCAKHSQLQRSASGSGMHLNTSCSLAISGIKTSSPTCIEIRHGRRPTYHSKSNDQQPALSPPKAYPADPSSRGSFNIQLISPERTSPRVANPIATLRASIAATSSSGNSRDTRFKARGDLKVTDLRRRGSGT